MEQFPMVHKKAGNARWKLLAYRIKKVANATFFIMIFNVNLMKNGEITYKQSFIFPLNSL